MALLCCATTRSPICPPRTTIASASSWKPNGVASTYMHNKVEGWRCAGSGGSARSFTLKPGDKPVVLLSAGVGATPVLAMLHALANERSPREVWWLFGARNREDHPFAEESRNLLERCRMAGARLIQPPNPQDRPGVEFDASGRITIDALEKIAVPRDADFYLCGPACVLAGLDRRTRDLGVSNDRVHSEIFGPEKPITPGIAETPHHRLTRPRAPPAPARMYPSPAAASTSLGTPNSQAFSNSPKPATSQCAGRAAPASATPAKAD